jgi:hypothetical protein
MEKLFSRAGFNNGTVIGKFLGIWGEKRTRHYFLGFEKGKIGEIRGGDEREDRVEFLV